jgi:hypothetical protein
MTSQILNRTRTQEQEEDLVPDGVLIPLDVAHHSGMISPTFPI